MTTDKIYKTRDYSKFGYVAHNRDINLNDRRAKNLMKSMMRDGFHSCSPIAVKKDANGRYIVQDGQRRLAIAKRLGIAVWYKPIDFDMDIAGIQDTQSQWKVDDYVKSWERRGNDHYRIVLDFSRTYNIPVSKSAAILSNTTSYANIIYSIKNGRYRIKSYNLAHSVGKCYLAFKNTKRVGNGARLIDAIFACHLVDHFEPHHLIQSVEKNPGMVSNYGDKDSFLDMIQEIYNHRRRAKVPLAFDAKEASLKNSPVLKQITRYK